jgi:hypothetical protein
MQSWERRIRKMEREMPSVPIDPEEMMAGNTYAPTGPELLGAAKIGVEMEVLNGRPIQPEEYLAMLDPYLEEHYGPAFTTWLEYWELRSYLEELIRNG